VLALAAATAVGASGADTRAWADAAGTGFAPVPVGGDQPSGDRCSS